VLLTGIPLRNGIIKYVRGHFIQSASETPNSRWSYFKVLEEYVNNRHYPADWLFAEAFLLWEKKMRQNQMWMEKPLFIVI